MCHMGDLLKSKDRDLDVILDRSEEMNRSEYWKRVPRLRQAMGLAGLRPTKTNSICDYFKSFS